MESKRSKSNITSDGDSDLASFNDLSSRIDKFRKDLSSDNVNEEEDEKAMEELTIETPTAGGPTHHHGHSLSTTPNLSLTSTETGQPIITSGGSSLPTIPPPNLTTIPTISQTQAPPRIKEDVVLAKDGDGVLPVIPALNIGANPELATKDDPLGILADDLPKESQETRLSPASSKFSTVNSPLQDDDTKNDDNIHDDQPATPSKSSSDDDDDEEPSSSDKHEDEEVSTDLASNEDLAAIIHETKKKHKKKRKRKKRKKKKKEEKKRKKASKNSKSFEADKSQPPVSQQEWQQMWDKKKSKGKGHSGQSQQNQSNIRIKLNTNTTRSISTHQVPQHRAKGLPAPHTVQNRYPTMTRSDKYGPLQIPSTPNQPQPSLSSPKTPTSLQPTPHNKMSMSTTPPAKSSNNMSVSTEQHAHSTHISNESPLKQKTRPSGSASTTQLIQSILPTGAQMGTGTFNLPLLGSVPNTLAGLANSTVVDPATGNIIHIPPDKLAEYHRQVAALATSLGGTRLPSVPNTEASSSNTPAANLGLGNAHSVSGSIVNQAMISAPNTSIPLQTQQSQPQPQSTYTASNLPNIPQQQNMNPSASQININSLNTGLDLGFAGNIVNPNLGQSYNVQSSSLGASGITGPAKSTSKTNRSNAPGPPSASEYYNYITPINNRNNNNTEPLSTTIPPPSIPVYSQYYQPPPPSDNYVPLPPSLPASQPDPVNPAPNIQNPSHQHQSVPNPSPPKSGRPPRPALNFHKAQDKYRQNRGNPHPLISQCIPVSGSNSMYPALITNTPVASHPFCLRLNEIPTARHGVSDRMDYVMKVNYFAIWMREASHRPHYGLRFISRMPEEVWAANKWKFLGCRNFDAPTFLRGLSSIIPAAKILEETYFCIFGSEQNEEVAWEGNHRHIMYTSLRTICFCPLKFYEAMIASGKYKTEDVHWHSKKFAQLSKITNWSMGDTAIMKILETIDLVCNNKTAQAYITEFTGARLTETSDMRRRYKRCYRLNLRYEAPDANAVRPKGGVSDPAIEKFVDYLRNKVGLSTQYFDVIRWKTRDSSSQQVQWYQSDMCKLYICDYAFFDAPAIIDHYDPASDEYNFFISNIGYVVKGSQWRINQRSYSNIVGKKPFNLSLDTIPESPVKVALPKNPTKWSDLAINSDLKYIPYYLDTGAMLSAMYGANRKAITATSVTHSANRSSFGWLDLAFKPDPVLENTANDVDESKLAAALQLNDSNNPEENKEEYKAPPTPTAIHKSSEARKNRFYKNRDEYGYIQLSPNRPYTHQPSTPSRTNINPEQAPMIQARGASAGGRRPAIDKSGYITAGSTKFDPYDQASYDYSDESDETVYSQVPPHKTQSISTKPTTSKKKKTKVSRSSAVQYLTDGAIPTTQQPIFRPFLGDYSSRSGDDPTPLEIIQKSEPNYTEQVIRAARDLSKLWIVDEERMEKYLIKTACPARYFCNPLLIWIELPMDVLKKKRCILNAGNKGRDRLTSRINDRKFRRRAKGKSYYITTLPSGWSMHVHNIPDIVPMDRWDGNYAFMLARREQVLIKLRETERTNFLRAAKSKSTATDQPNDTTTSQTGTKSSRTKPKTSKQPTTDTTNATNPQQQESSDDNDDITQMEDVD